MEAAAASSGLANCPHLPVFPLQAAAAHPRTDPHGIPTGWDHPHPRSHADPQLPAHQAEPLQQPDHHAVQLPQVKADEVPLIVVDGSVLTLHDLYLFSD